MTQVVPHGVSLILSLAAATIMAAFATSESPGGLRDLVIADRAIAAGLICYVGCNLALRLHRLPGQLARLRRSDWVLVAGLVVVLVVRLLEPIILIHPDQEGYRDVVRALDLVVADASRIVYGQGGQLTQGLVGHVLGGDIRGVVTGNVLLSVAAIGFIAALVRRYSGSRVAAPLAVLILAACNPVLVRTAASEDVHTVGALYAFMSIWALERWTARRRAEDLYLCVAACLLAAFSRHFFAPMPVLLVFLFVERRAWRGAARAPVALAGGVLAVTLVVHFWGSAVSAGTTNYARMFEAFGGTWPALAAHIEAGLQLALKEPYPLVDQAIFPLPLLALVVVGLIALARGGRAPRSMLLAWGVLAFVAAVGPGFWGIEHRYYFRSAFMYVTFLVVGLGWGVVYRGIESRWPRHWVRGVYIGISVLVPVAMSVPDIVRRAEQSVFTQEVLFVEGIVERLPPRFTLVRLTKAGLRSRFATLSPDFVDDLIRRRTEEQMQVMDIARWRDRDPAAPIMQPVLWYQGGICHQASLYELHPAFGGDEIVLPDDPVAFMVEFLSMGDIPPEWIRQRRRHCLLPDKIVEPVRGLTTTLVPPRIEEGPTFSVREPFTVGFYRVRHDGDRAD